MVTLTKASGSEDGEVAGVTGLERYYAGVQA